MPLYPGALPLPFRSQQVSLAPVLPLWWHLSNYFLIAGLLVYFPWLTFSLWTDRRDQPCLLQWCKRSTQLSAFPGAGGQPLFVEMNSVGLKPPLRAASAVDLGSQHDLNCSLNRPTLYFFHLAYFKNKIKLDSSHFLHGRKQPLFREIQKRLVAWARGSCNLHKSPLKCGHTFSYNKKPESPENWVTVQPWCEEAPQPGWKLGSHSR